MAVHSIKPWPDLSLFDSTYLHHAIRLVGGEDVETDPGGEYLTLAKKGTSDYNYNEQKEITYSNDAILTGIFEKGGMSYVYKNGKFISFVSSD